MATKVFCDKCDREIKSQVKPSNVRLRFRRPEGGGDTTTLKMELSANYGMMDICLRCVVEELQKELDMHDPQPKHDGVSVRDEEER